MILSPVKQREGFDLGVSHEVENERVHREWGNKHRSPNEYLVACDGGHLLVPFECDLCIFRKLRSYGPLLTSEQDQLLLACIQRITLDAFWSRAKSTVLANQDKIRQCLALSQLVGLDGPYVSHGVMPATDTFGYEVRIETVLALRRPGKYKGKT
jgi:hypothetical protein